MADSWTRFTAATWTLRKEEPIERLVEYLRRPDVGLAGIAVLVAEALDPRGNSQFKLTLSQRGRGRRRRRVGDTNDYRAAAARANKRQDAGGSYEAELAQACEETGLVRSEMASWMSAAREDPVLLAKHNERMRRLNHAEGIFGPGDEPEIAIYKVARKAVWHINRGADAEEELGRAATEARVDRFEMYKWIWNVAQAERWQKFNSLPERPQDD
jgi:hypothetical protein